MAFQSHFVFFLAHSPLTGEAFTCRALRYHSQVHSTLASRFPMLGHIIFALGASTRGSLYLVHSIFPPRTYPFHPSPPSKLFRNTLRHSNSNTPRIKVPPVGPFTTSTTLSLTYLPIHGQHINISTPISTLIDAVLNLFLCFPRSYYNPEP
jgi:hypothetical protein